MFRAGISHAVPLVPAVLETGVDLVQRVNGVPGTVYDGVYHTPLGRFSTLDCSTTKRLPIPNDYVFGKLSARCFKREPCWHRYNSNCGDVEHGKSAEGCVITRRAWSYSTHYCCINSPGATKVGIGNVSPRAFRDVSFGTGTLLVVEQSSVENRPTGL